MTTGAYEYNNDLRIYVDGSDRTAVILTQLGIAALGDGTSTHAFVTTGYTIDLLLLGAIWNGGAGSALSAGRHTIQFRQIAGVAGGKVRSNLEINA